MGVLLREDVEVIWERLQAGDKGNAIARDFMISQQTVSAINTGKIWNSVTGLNEAPDPLANNHRSKLTVENVRWIDALIELDIPTGKIAEAYQVSPSAISQIKSGKTWGHITGRNREEYE